MADSDPPDRGDTRATDSTSEGARAPFVRGRFTGKTAVVTADRSGLGQATAVRLAMEGARVVAADVVADRLADLDTEYPELNLVTVVS